MSVTKMETPDDNKDETAILAEKNQIQCAYIKEEFQVKIEEIDYEEELGNIEQADPLSVYQTDKYDDVIPEIIVPHKHQEETVESTNPPKSHVVEKQHEDVPAGVVGMFKTWENHCDQLNAITSYFCSICSESFSLKNDFENHITVHNNEELLQYFIGSQLYLAKKDSLFVGQFHCSICNESFSREDTLRKHSMIHNSERRFSCVICNRLFNRRADLKRHTMIHNNEKPFACPECYRAFSQKSHLKVHIIEVHYKEKHFLCTICGRSFIRQQHLNNHMMTHNNEKPFTCTICNRSFSRKGDLKRHTMTHSNEKPFECSVCGRAFSQKCHLKMHIFEIHKNGKPFPCDTCGQSFSRKYYLNLHEMVHNNEKPFSCTQIVASHFLKNKA